MYNHPAARPVHPRGSVSIIIFASSSAFPKAITSYTILHKRAVASFQKALTNFQRDGGKDGPFGFGYALCRLAILLLRCGDNGRTMDILIPPKLIITFT
jgi:hypothetical protein